MLIRARLQNEVLKGVDKFLDGLQEDGQVRRLGFLSSRLKAVQDNAQELQERGTGGILGLGILPRLQETMQSRTQPRTPEAPPPPPPLIQPTEEELQAAYLQQQQAPPGIGSGMHLGVQEGGSVRNKSGKISVY